MNAPVSFAPGGASEARQAKAPGATACIRHDRFLIPLAPPALLRFYLDHLLVPHSRGELLRSGLARTIGPVAALLDGQSCDQAAEFPLAELAALLRREGVLHGKISAITLGDYENSARKKSVAFLFEGREPRPRLIAKLSSDPAHSHNLEHEYRALGLLRDRLGDAQRETVPAPMTKGSARGTAVFCQQVLPGTAMYVQTRSSWLPRRLVQRHFGLAGDWLTQFQQATRSGEIRLGESGSAEALAALQQVASLAPQAADFITAAIRRTEALADVRLPVVAVHGDFWTRNLLVSGAQLGVIDWENYREQGLPFDDLFHFITSYGQSFPWQLGRWSDPVRAFRATFAAPGWMSRFVQQAVRRHCLHSGMSPLLPAALFPAFLARRALEHGGIWLSLFDEFSRMDPCACFGS